MKSTLFVVSVVGLTFSAWALATVPGSAANQESPEALIPTIEKVIDPSINYGGMLTDAGLEPGEIALTFDDGPHPKYTPKLLKILDHYGVKGTFFLSGVNAQRFPGLVQELIKRGHSIGSHTFRHVNMHEMSRKEGAAAVRAEMLRGVEAGERASGLAHVPFFRFPFLDYDHTSLNVAHQLGLVVFDWNKISMSPWGIRPKMVRGTDGLLVPVLAKGIALSHASTTKEVENMPLFLEAMKKWGYKAVVFVTPK